MRLWTLHPENLDRQGLLAVWREGLLAQAVLRGKTKGYKHHPQLNRFKKVPGAIGAYLLEIWNEAKRRGYFFDRKKIGNSRSSGKIPVSRGQVTLELDHLKRKLEKRRPGDLGRISGKIHPLFRTVPGEAPEPWERL